VSPPCRTPLALAELVAYERGELAVVDAERVEAHYFACAGCTRRLETVAALGAAIAGLFRAGRVSASVTAELLARATAGGLAVRSYRLAPGQIVACTAGPTDDFIAMRFGLTDLADGEAESVDLLAEILDVASGERRTQLTENVPVDHAEREIVYAWSAALVRTLPRTRWTMQARIRGPHGERTLGPYTLDHTPWDQLVEPADP
jgi:anti-sigma factor RsiW